MAYDFTTLSPDDFEELAADLLSHNWGIRLEAFKRGKDRGIDLRNTRVLEPSGTTIVQCKRYAPHKFAELLRAVNSEKVKIDVLRPTRYVLATSVPLSPDNKDALIAALHPWCKSTGDIYGATELTAFFETTLMLRGRISNSGSLALPSLSASCIHAFSTLRKRL